MEKAFKKQTKAIKDQGEKQVDALKTLKPKELEATEDNKPDDNEKLLKYKYIFYELSNEGIGEIYNISKQIDFSNLTYYFEDKNITPINFIGFRGPMHIYNDIKDGNISIEKIEEDQKEFRLSFNKIATENPKKNSKDNLNTIKNIKNFHDSKKRL